MTLASWFYRGVVNDTLGPIARVNVRPATDAQGMPCWEAAAYLHPKVMEGLDTARQRHLYGDGDGSGTASSRSIACHIAISEALERWAFRSTVASETNKHNFGLDIDPSTSGFAAWPGPFSRLAKKRAFNEAVERWLIPAWWDGLVGHHTLPDPKLNILKLDSYWHKTSTFIVSKVTKNGFHAYGFSCADDDSQALHRASIELYRNCMVLDKWAEAGEREDNLTAIDEKRLFFFARSKGHQLFRSRVSHQEGQRATSRNIPKLIVDRRVHGAWDKYVTVWRCLFEPIWVDDNQRLERFLF